MRIATLLHRHARRVRSAHRKGQRRTSAYELHRMLRKFIRRDFDTLQELIQPLLQKAPLRLQLRRLQGASVGVSCVVQAAEAAAEVGAC